MDPNDQIEWKNKKNKLSTELEKYTGSKNDESENIQLKSELKSDDYKKKTTKEKKENKKNRKAKQKLKTSDCCCYFDI
ncbi:hypothetical protein M0802_013607 [Mischocyttarus mexicanus]|nr:hypothetical protein M0802_013607 [Mischocyttarus mexicanus]